MPTRPITLANRYKHQTKITSPILSLATVASRAPREVNLLDARKAWLFPLSDSENCGDITWKMGAPCRSITGVANKSKNPGECSYWDFAIDSNNLGFAINSQNLGLEVEF